jgi:hypothetical protein
MDSIVQTITDQVMRFMNGSANGSTAVKDGGYASGISGGA